MHRHVADPLLVLQLQPGREWYLLTDLGDELLVHHGAPLQAVQGMLQLIHELVGFSSKTSGVTGGLQVGDRANLISFCLIRNQCEVPPGALLLCPFRFRFFVPILVCESALHKMRETIAFHHSYEVEVEISPILGCSFTVQGECSVESDLLLHQSTTASLSIEQPFCSSMTCVT